MREPFNSNPREQWLNCPATHGYFLSRLALVNQTSKPNNSRSGNGILYVGGGPYWPGIVVGIRLLRESGCTLPIEVWYRGSCEKINPEDVKHLSVSLHDVDEYSQRLDDNRIPSGDIKTGGWEAKLYALQHTTLARVLFLDADAYCIADPTGMIQNMVEPFQFWKDFDSMGGNIKWHAVYPDGNKGVPPIQGGQLLIDLGRAHRSLDMCHFMCQNSDFYFKHAFGDQDCWRIAIAASGESYKVRGDALWNSTAFVCNYDGVPSIIHRCQGKLFRPRDIPPDRLGYSSPQPQIPGETKTFRHLACVLGREPEIEESFSPHYDRQLWGDGSGAGSAPAEALPYIDLLNGLKHLTGWKSVVDVGCGDGRVAAQLGFEKYIGFDSTPKAIEKFSANAVHYTAVVHNCLVDVDRFPPADVLLCKDVLHHWPNHWVDAWLWRMSHIKDRWKAIILTFDRFQWEDGQDTYPGGYRGLDWTMKPLNKWKFVKLSDYLHKTVLIFTGERNS